MKLKAIAFFGNSFDRQNPVDGLDTRIIEGSTASVESGVLQIVEYGPYLCVSGPVAVLKRWEHLLRGDGVDHIVYATSILERNIQAVHQAFAKENTNLGIDVKTHFTNNVPAKAEKFSSSTLTAEMRIGTKHRDKLLARPERYHIVTHVNERPLEIISFSSSPIAGLICNTELPLSVRRNLQGFFRGRHIPSYLAGYLFTVPTEYRAEVIEAGASVDEVPEASSQLIPKAALAPHAKKTTKQPG